ncbi:MAG: TM0106 family RecB-like putative nuclease [Gemmatimonadaceae bacterium]
MRLHGPRLVLSATDVSNFLGCRHRTALDMAAAHGAREIRYDQDPLLELLWQKGAEHEQRYVDRLRSEGLTFVDLRSAPKILTATLAAMRDGVDIIVQGALGDDRWFGKPDIMWRVAKPGTSWAWSYEISDTKLARETKAGTILQLGLYSELLADIQGIRPEYFHVVTPDAIAPVKSYRVDDYAAYFRQTRASLLVETAADYEAMIAEYYPDPVDHCEICQWRTACASKRRADDHLSLVANITRGQRRELQAQSVETLTALASLPFPLEFKPKRGSPESYDRVIDQARLQLESRGKTPPLHELLAIEPNRGLCRLPEPSEGDLFLDLEGDPFGAGGEHGRDYLFGLARADGSYVARWAFDDADERQGFEWVMDTIAAAVREHPSMHVYHYAPYEPAAFKRLMGRYATRDRELDEMLRAGRFVDLYAVVRQGMRAGIERYSIKNLEPLYSFERTVPLFEANRGLKLVELALGIGVAHELPAEILRVVEGYNRDDCVSTLRLRNWLEQIRGEHVASGEEIPRAVLANGEPPEDVSDKEKKVAELRARLLEGVSEDHDDRDPEAQAKWLLAYMLDYHRREAKSTWWEYFRLCDMDVDELLDQRAAVAGLAFVDRVDEKKNKKTGKPTGTVTDRYSYPVQEMEIDAGDQVWMQDKKRFGVVAAVDRVARTIDVAKMTARRDVHPPAIFEFKVIGCEEQENALARIAEASIENFAAYGAARAMLSPREPRVTGGGFTSTPNESESDFAIRLAPRLDETTLAIQGPPGSGKTYIGARMICELVKQGKKVGVTATGHKVIRNLLDAVLEQAKQTGVDLRLGHKCDDDETAGEEGPIKLLRANPEALAALQSGEVNVLGGTAWMWSRPEFVQAAHVLFIDEAGQLALANAIAVSQGAKSVVLLGDPQQLEQPTKGSHPDGVDASALQHVLEKDKTIPKDRGIFLPVTRRLPPSICEFTSEIFYERRLTSLDGLMRQRLRGVGDLPSVGLAMVQTDHDGNKNYAPEEIDVVAGLVARLTAPGAGWINREGVEAQLTGADILVVAPYNAHVSRVAQRLDGTGVRVGTVDKFQGLEAPVVIYSMATSRPEDAPRGMEFLYSLNRLNVATSRAKCLAILVASPHLFEPECRSPRQMQLANALCRFREIATPIVM